MAAFDLKTFVSPLASPVNLVTIIVVALLFGIYRLSGGGIDVVQKNSAARRGYSAPLTQERARPNLVPPPSRDSETRDLNDLLGNKGSSASRSSSSQGGGDLSEIEKMLGIQ